MSERVPIDPERLLAQTAWVRRLARSLARDEASADDLVQETFAAALRRPPAGAQDEPRLRAWFGFVLRNMAFRRSRSEARREERERRSAQGGRSESDERADELEDLRAELFKHVKALPEISREVVLLRYFEELDSAEIARRLGVPDSTVRNRLRRALAELRERLERDHGSDWRSLCLFALPNTGAKVAAGGGALAAAGGMGLGLGALGVCALAFALWIGLYSVRPSAERESLAAVQIPPAADASESPFAGSAPGRDSSTAALDSTRAPEAGALRIVVSDENEPPRSTPFDHGIIVHGVVRDDQGQPIDNVYLGWTDAWGRVRSTGTSDGKYSANSLAPGRQLVRLHGPACGESFQEVVLAEDQELQCFDFRVHRSHAVPVYALDPDGTNLLDPGVTCDPLRRGCLVAVVTLAAPPARLTISTDSDDYHPEYSVMFGGWERGVATPPGALGEIDLQEGSPRFVSLVHLGTVLQTQHLESIPERVTFEVERSRLAHAPGETSTIARGWVVGSNGARYPLPAGRRAEPERIAPVHLQFLDPMARPVMANFTFLPAAEGAEEFGATAHTNGTYDWDGMQPGKYVLQIHGSRDDIDPTFAHVGALPRRVELVAGDVPNEIVVSMSPVQKLLLRSRCGAEEWFRWEIATGDGLSVTRGKVIGHAPTTLELPPGSFVLQIHAGSEVRLLAEQEFRVDSKPRVIDLVR